MLMYVCTSLYVGTTYILQIRVENICSIVGITEIIIFWIETWRLRTILLVSDAVEL